VTQQGVNEEFYLHVADAHGSGEYSEQEQLAIQYAERFVLDHTHLDDEFFARLREQFTDAEVLDLTICIAAFLGLGRMLRVLGIDQTEQLDV
jgi:alkylhydroperoxidase family enzyme